MDPAPGIERVCASRDSPQAFVALDVDFIAASALVVLHPVERRRAPDEAEPVVTQKKENGVSNHVTIVIAGDELFDLVDLEMLKLFRPDRAVSTRPVPRDRVRHVMRLVEKCASRATTLLVAPVRELNGTTGNAYGPICELRNN